jgi:hypothetical protein
MSVMSCDCAFEGVGVALHWGWDFLTPPLNSIEVFFDL